MSSRTSKATAALPVKEYLRLLRRSDLLRSSALGQANELAGSIQDAVRLGEELVRLGILTHWQNSQLQGGRSRGFLLGRYILLDVLGGGGVCRVYLGEHTILNRHGAIKVLARARSNRGSLSERLIQEARAIACLKHPNVVEAYDIGAHNGLHYIVMELVRGIDLARMVKCTGPLREERAADYVIQAAAGLHHAHQHDIVHRDVKPANLLVDSSGVVKVLDLGVARVESLEQSSITLKYDEKILGTVDYLAPEQARNSHNVDLRADIYGLGCTLYFLLSGQPPFAQGSLAERTLKHQFEMPVPIDRLQPKVSPELANICQRMMAKQPDARYQSMDEVIRVLKLWWTARTIERAAEETHRGDNTADTRILLRRESLEAIGLGNG